jgi:hypothetical protein
MRESSINYFTFRIFENLILIDQFKKLNKFNKLDKFGHLCYKIGY